MERRLVKKKTTGDVVDRTIQMMESLFQDCPTPTQEEFKRMAGMQMAFMNALSMNLMNSMTGDKKLDRGLLRLSMKASEQCLKAVQVGAAITLPESESD
jgi:hypothetical protein